MQSAYRALYAEGGRILVVGGAVRDAVLGLNPKDHDFEVYGLSWNQVLKVLSPLGRVNEVGKSFGIIKLTSLHNKDLDISFPLRENVTGRGYRGIESKIDPTITPREAASRRDFTFNAMAYDPGRREFFDFFGGIKDLHEKVLRFIGPAFSEDPERVRRGMQFAARFGLTASPETLTLCKSLLPLANTSPLSRVWGEWEKWALKGKQPSVGLRFLRDCGWVATVPELQALVGLPFGSSNEDDAFEYTAHICDAGVQISEQESLTGRARIILLFACVGHYMGQHNRELITADSNIIGHGQVEASQSIAQMLERIGAPKTIKAKVIPLVRWHSVYITHSDQFQNQPRATVQTLAENLQPATIREWAQVVAATQKELHPLLTSNPVSAWVQKAEEAGCDNGPIAGVLQGRHLLTIRMEPGPKMGELLRVARQAQVADKFRDLQGAFEWLRTEGKL